MGMFIAFLDKKCKFPRANLNKKMVKKTRVWRVETCMSYLKVL